MLVEQSTNDSPGHADQRLRYDPLTDHTGLFRTFAETEATPEGVRRFASIYGFQYERDLDRLGWFRLTVPKLYGDNTAVYAEPFESWRDNILNVREVLLIWDLARQENTRELRRYLRWKEGELLLRSDVHELEGEYTVIDNIHRPTEQRIGFSQGDLLKPARYVAGTFVNTYLEGEVSPGLLWDRTDFSHHLTILPQSLVGALWLQFARAIDRDREYRACLNCGDWFEVGQGAASRARQFCSNKCRVAHSRKRRAQASGENP